MDPGGPATHRFGCPLELGGLFLPQLPHLLLRKKGSGISCKRVCGAGEPLLGGGRTLGAVEGVCVEGGGEEEEKRLARLETRPLRGIQAGQRAHLLVHLHRRRVSRHPRLYLWGRHCMGKRVCGGGEGGGGGG